MGYSFFEKGDPKLLIAQVCHVHPDKDAALNECDNIDSTVSDCGIPGQAIFPVALRVADDTSTGGLDVLAAINLTN